MKYSLYHGCLNTFVITDFQENIDYSKLALSKCAELKTDGFIVVVRNPLEMIYFNADGSEAPMCGNGLRCFVRYCYENNIVSNKAFDVETKAGKMEVEITSEEPFRVLINMGRALFDTEVSAIDTELDNFINQQLKIDGKEYSVSTIFMNTIHTVLFVDNFDNIDDLGKKICNHPIYLKKTNVNFVEIINMDNIRVKTYERGIGWTKACGTGACSAFVLGILEGKLSNKVKVNFDGGEVELYINDKLEVFMEGPTDFIGCKE